MSVTTERSAVEAAATEYFDAWFDGDGERIAQILHPDLCKRRVRESLSFTTREQMVEWTAEGRGVPQAAERSLDVVVLDAYGDIASVRVRSAVYYEYLHLVRTDDGWKIANALFEQLDATEAEARAARLRARDGPLDGRPDPFASAFQHV